MKVSRITRARAQRARHNSSFDDTQLALVRVAGWQIGGIGIVFGVLMLLTYLKVI